MNNPNEKGKAINRFDDTFHHYHDDDDETEDKNVDFDNITTNTGRDNINNDDIYGANDEELVLAMIRTEEMLENEVIEIPTTPKPEEGQEQEEKHLSQKLSQLSASGETSIREDLKVYSSIQKRPAITPTTEPTRESIIKKFKSNIYDDDDDGTANTDVNDTVNKRNERLVYYLCPDHGEFDSTCQSMVQNKISDAKMEQLRKFAQVIHQLKCIELDRSLCNKYLQSGTGELVHQDNIKSILSKKITKLPILQIWPMEIKERIAKLKYPTGKNPKDIDYDECLNYVQQMLTKYEKQEIFYQDQIKDIQQKLRSTILSPELEKAIIEFVLETGVTLHQIHINRFIAATEYDYRDQLLQLEFNQERPNEYQKETFSKLFESKRTKEEAVLNVSILKQRVLHKQLPKSFESLRLPDPIELDKLIDNKIRQRLVEQSKKILQRTRSEMMLVYMAAAELKANELTEKFDKDMAMMKRSVNDYHTSEKLNEKMLDILNRRLNNLDQRLQTIYKLKLSFFERAPTEMN